jgi:hypothetical protein
MVGMHLPAADAAVADGHPQLPRGAHHCCLHMCIAALLTLHGSRQHGAGTSDMAELTMRSEASSAKSLPRTPKYSLQKGHIMTT